MVQMQSGRRPAKLAVDPKLNHTTGKSRKMPFTSVNIPRPLVRRVTMDSAKPKMASKSTHINRSTKPFEPLTRHHSTVDSIAVKTTKSISSSTSKVDSNQRQTSGTRLKSILKREPSLYGSISPVPAGFLETINPDTRKGPRESNKSASCYRLPSKERPKLRKAVSFRDESERYHGIKVLSRLENSQFCSSKREEFV